MPRIRNNAKVGDRTVVTRLPGYKLHQNRPFVCQPVCQCGECNGVKTDYPGTITAIYSYSDAREARVLCDDGETRTITLEYYPDVP